MFSFCFRLSIKLRICIGHTFYIKVRLDTMGADVCSHNNTQFQFSVDPLVSHLIHCDPVMISSEYIKIFQKIKLLRDVNDPRIQSKLKWYMSEKYGFKFYGTIQKGRPFGQCIFYFQNQQESKLNTVPVFITTKIDSHYVFAKNTLLIYSDKSYYIGQIHTKVYELPRASGQGFLVTKDYIYEGQFEEGVPHGYGRYRTKAVEFIGQFIRGAPKGEGIQRSAKGMFVGQFSPNSKKGYLITPDNKKVQIDLQRTSHDLI